MGEIPYLCHSDTFPKRFIFIPVARLADSDPPTLFLLPPPPMFLISPSMALIRVLDHIAWPRSTVDRLSLEVLVLGEQLAQAGDGPNPA
jgi:hypothetical protein